MEYFNAFIVGGLICTAGQILVNKTKLTSGRILVIFVVSGCILGSLGIYEAIANFGGAGAMVPITGFGFLLWQGVKNQINERGAIGILTGGLMSASAGIGVAILFSFISSLLFSPKAK